MRDYLRSFANSESAIQVGKVGLIGVANTVVSIALLNACLKVLGRTDSSTVGFDVKLFSATAIAFTLTTLMSYILNRRWTFELGGTANARKETAKFFAINAVALAVTQTIVSGADSMFGLTNQQATLAYILASGVIILPKFAGYRDVVFKHALESDTSGVRSPVG